MNAQATVQAFFDPNTWTVSYVVADSPPGAPPSDDNGITYLRIPLNALPLHR